MGNIRRTGFKRNVSKMASRFRSLTETNFMWKTTTLYVLMTGVVTPHCFCRPGQGNTQNYKRHIHKARDSATVRLTDSYLFPWFLLTERVEKISAEWIIKYLLVAPNKESFSSHPLNVRRLFPPTVQKHALADSELSMSVFHIYIWHFRHNKITTMLKGQTAATQQWWGLIRHPSDYWSCTLTTTLWLLWTCV